MLHSFGVTYNHKFKDWLTLVLYFKHSELADRYRVSLKTVHNWVDATKRGKLNLQLHDHDGRTYIANTPSNVVALEQQVQKGKKYRNTLHHKVVTPKPEFYDLYSRRQILDIISNLSIHREIPRQYNYFDGGAQNWDNWVRRVEAEGSPSILKGTVELLDANLDALNALLAGNSRVNVIDIGVGNAYPVRGLLQFLIERDLLHRYIAVDISAEMLSIAEGNIKKWFGGRVAFEGHIRDIAFERFDDLIVDDMLAKDAEQTANLVLLLGATPMNFPQPHDSLKVVYSSMGSNDLLIYTDKPDTAAERRYFDFNPKPGLVTELSPNHRMILDLMSIDSSLYDVDMGFNERAHMRYIRIKLKTALTIKFKFDDGERDVHLEKGEAILMLRIWHKTALQIISEFENVGFTLLQSSLTKDRQFLLTISGVEAKPNT